MKSALIQIKFNGIKWRAAEIIVSEVPASSSPPTAPRARPHDADRVFHPDYDDFSETAFCCGGIYLARRGSN